MHPVQPVGARATPDLSPLGTPRPATETNVVADAPRQNAGAPPAVDNLSKTTPARIAQLKAEVLAIARANTLRTDNLEEVRARLEPLVAELGAYFAANRPADEVKKLRGNWKSVWFDNADITDRGPAKLQRDRVFQVVEDGFYYNASDYKVLGGTVSTFLRGDYVIEKPANRENAGQPGLNVVRLTFGETRLRLGALPADSRVRKLTLDVANREVSSVPTPGPKGITGRLWNVFLDDTLRISVGYSDRKPDRIDYYVLTRV